MKKLIILTLTALSLTACQAKPAVETTLQYKDFAPETAQEQLDEDTLVFAVKSENRALCATLMNPTQKDNCVLKINDQSFLKKARENADKKFCSAIKEPVTKTQCELIVEDILADMKVAEEAEKEQEVAQELADKKDLKGCKGLKDKNLQEQCEVNIYNKKALEERNPEHCENIDPRDLREACRAQIE